MKLNSIPKSHIFYTCPNSCLIHLHSNDTLQTFQILLTYTQFLLLLGYQSTMRPSCMKYRPPLHWLQSRQTVYKGGHIKVKQSHYGPGQSLRVPGG